LNALSSAGLLFTLLVVAVMTLPEKTAFERNHHSCSASVHLAESLSNGVNRDRNTIQDGELASPLSGSTPTFS